MSRTITSLGKCPYTNRKQYLTQSDAMQVANSYSNMNFEVIQCPHCGHWEIKVKTAQPDTSSVDTFLDEQTDPIAEAKKLLEENGYGVIPPENYNYVYKVLMSFKTLRKELGLVFKDEGEGDK